MSGVWGSFGTAINNLIYSKNSDAARQAAIEEKDERNRAITDRAKAKAFDLTILSFFALILAFGLMGVELYLVITLAVVYLFVLLADAYYRVKYHKEM